MEVYYNSTWGTVCDDYWDIRDSEVVCRQLGFASAVSFEPLGHYGQGLGKWAWSVGVANITVKRCLYWLGFIGWVFYGWP